MLRLRLYGRLSESAPQAGVPLAVSWESAFEQLSQLPRMFAEPDGSFLWKGEENDHGGWQLEGTLFDDGQFVRRVELVGNCTVSAWERFLRALDCRWDNISIESLNDNRLVDGQWLRAQALDADTQ